MSLFRCALMLLWLVAPLAMAAEGLFREAWHDGTGEEPILQVQRLDRDSFILRQSIRTNFEGPFLFLFFGSEKILLIDSGAGGVKIRPTIDRIIADWRKENAKPPMKLVVAHTHGHGDHVAGDPEFAGDPNVTLVGHAPEQVAAFFGIKNWPEQIASFDLGGRIIDIIPSPGHEPAEISFFDRHTRLLLTGDALYPGRLYCTSDNFPDYRRSIDRLVAFTRDLNVAWILGNHIEMTDVAKRDYAMHALDHPHEHRLELTYASLLALQKDVDRMGARPELTIEDDFIFYPLP